MSKRFFVCMEATYPYVVKNQRGARNTPYNCVISGYLGFQGEYNFFSGLNYDEKTLNWATNNETIQSILNHKTMKFIQIRNL